MTTGPLDPNRTVWQRLNDHLLPLVDSDSAGLITSYLHPYIVAERNNARDGGLS